MLIFMEFKELLAVRAKMKSKKPHFKRHDRNKLGRLARKTWRSSVLGHDNKVRNKYAGNERMPSPGYGSPKAVRGLHASGLSEAIVHNASQLKALDPKKIAVRIAATVGNRKKIGIVAEAKKLSFKILNPKVDLKAPKEKEKNKSESSKGGDAKSEAKEEKKALPAKEKEKETKAEPGVKNAASR